MTTTTVKLSASAIRELMLGCLFTENEAPKDAVIAEGVLHTFGFQPERLASHKGEIRELLEQLPPQFKKSSGSGGGHFLHACVTKDGDQWGEHSDIEQLMCLGLAVGLVTYCMPRELWAMTFGLPYFVYDDEAKVEG